MPTEPRHAEAESRFRAIVAEAGVAEPDAVEYRADAVVFYWHGPRVAVCVDLERGDAQASVAPSSRR